MTHSHILTFVFPFHAFSRYRRFLPSRLSPAPGSYREGACGHNDARDVPKTRKERKEEIKSSFRKETKRTNGFLPVKGFFLFLYAFVITYCGHAEGTKNRRICFDGFGFYRRENECMAKAIAAKDPIYRIPPALHCPEGLQKPGVENPKIAHVIYLLSWPFHGLAHILTHSLVRYCTLSLFRPFAWHVTTCGVENYSSSQKKERKLTHTFTQSGSRTKKPFGHYIRRKEEVKNLQTLNTPNLVRHRSFFFREASIQRDKRLFVFGTI